MPKRTRVRTDSRRRLNLLRRAIEKFEANPTEGNFRSAVIIAVCFVMADLRSKALIDAIANIKRQISTTSNSVHWLTR